MDEENVLQEMAAFDLSKPFSVTIICDDDEDQNKLRKIRKKENSNNHDTSCTSTGSNKEIDHTSNIKNPDIDEPQSNNNNLNKIETKDATVAPLKNNKNNKDSNNYIDDLLTKLSESLLHILEAYFNHISNVHLYNINDYRLQDSKRRFNCIKHHFFQLSYCTTNVIILSRENDTKFTDNFLDSTMKLAKQKNMKISVQQIQPLYYELISWVKQVKKMQTLPINPVIPNYNNSSELRKYLARPPVSSAMPDSINSSPKAKVSIHNSDTQKPEIRISLETDSQSNDIIKNRQLEYSSPNYYNRNTQPGFAHVEQRYPNSQLLRSNNYQFGYNLTNDVQNFCRPNVSEVTATATTNKFKDCVAHENRCMVANCLCQNPSKVDMANPMNIRLPPTYQEANVWKNVSTRENRYDNISKQYEDANNAYSNMDNILRPDSGFISPQQLNSPLENMVVQDVQNTTTTATPLITHVTSLNPSAMHIAEGACHVCRTSTKQKCLGCYQTYYCSYQCQKQDWNQHMSICKSRSASRQSTNVFF
ncbi:hypothetical protein evm_010804 [Chilo suppressalis]|nr:hypothetical protein evm_010804 [Chilo suppressalis]